MQIVKIQNPFNLAQSEVFYCLKQINVAEIVAEYNISPQNLPFMSDVYQVVRGAVDSEAVLQTTPDFEIYTGTARERTHFAFGTKGKMSMMAKVIGVRPRGDTVEISCVNESEEVYKT